MTNAMNQIYFITPHDVLFLRGNKDFGAAGSFGEASMPPLPSVFAGALRSALLTRDGTDLVAFKNTPHPTLGTPSNPGNFYLRGLRLARTVRGTVECVYPMPADVRVSISDAQKTNIRPIAPTVLHPKLQSSAATAQLAVLPEPTRSKPVNGSWLSQTGWAAYLNGQALTASHLVKQSDLWQIQSRVGIGMSRATRSVEDGKLFTTEAVCFHAGVGFVVDTAGADFAAVDLLRLGGDGRSAAMQAITAPTIAPDYTAIAQSKRCRLILTTPGLFAHGWQPTGSSVINGELHLNLHGVSGRIVCAAVPRFDVISGFDLATRQPKTAERAAPTGCVYWLDDLQLTSDATGTLADALRKLAEHGLWEASEHNTARRAEGLNRVAVGC